MRCVQSFVGGISGSTTNVHSSWWPNSVVWGNMLQITLNSGLVGNRIRLFSVYRLFINPDKFNNRHFLQSYLKRRDLRGQETRRFSINIVSKYHASFNATAYGRSSSRSFKCRHSDASPCKKLYVCTDHYEDTFAQQPALPACMQSLCNPVYWWNHELLCALLTVDDRPTCGVLTSWLLIHRNVCVPSPIFLASWRHSNCVQSAQWGAEIGGKTRRRRQAVASVIHCRSKRHSTQSQVITAVAAAAAAAAAATTAVGAAPMRGDFGRWFGCTHGCTTVR
jgi:hypothetical protein